MITKEMIKNEVDKLPVERLEPVYQYIVKTELHNPSKHINKISIEDNDVKKSKGIFAKDKNPELIQSGKSAWVEVVMEKQADYRR